ncbi:MAG TPA: hypothetical protein VFI73_09425 [Candidatus Nitrosopolaris sp.]|nr:hypothetical protein [Candidatus Nitrosopolaris sp.]
MSTYYVETVNPNTGLNYAAREEMIQLYVRPAPSMALSKLIVECITRGEITRLERTKKN